MEEVEVMATKSKNIYNEFMRGTTQDFAYKVDQVFQRLTPEVLRKHRITRLPHRKRIPLAVYLINISHDGLIAEYKVRLGEFRVYIKVLNLTIEMSQIKYKACL
jgi:hypothetical protein